MRIPQAINVNPWAGIGESGKRIGTYKKIID